MKIRNEIYKHPHLVCIIRFIYHEIIEGFFNGYYLYMLKYLLTIKKKEFVALDALGFHDIKPYKTKSWRRGDELDRAHRRYYIAYYGSEPCFIKIAENDKTIQNEIEVANHIKDLQWSFVPATYLVEPNFMGSRKLLAISYKEGVHSIPDDIAAEELALLCVDFLEIHKSLLRANLVHADIHRGNLVLDANNHLLLLDFGISKFLDSSNNVDYVARPGTFFQVTEWGRIYDDAFSFIKMIERLTAFSKVSQAPELLAVSKRIGMGSFNVIINK